LLLGVVGAGQALQPGIQPTDQALVTLGSEVVIEHVGEQREDDREPDQVDEDRQAQDRQ